MSSPVEDKEASVGASAAASSSADDDDDSDNNETTKDGLSASVPEKSKAKANATDEPVSKSQTKRQRRWEMAMEKKRRRKQQEKDTKRAKALAQGRDLDEERRLQEERTKSGEGARKREEKWLERMKAADTSFRVCIDCGYNDRMTQKELNSLALQIRYSYSCNRKAEKPVYYSVAGLDGTILESMKKVQGFPEQWLKRAFSYSEGPLFQLHPDKSKLVYLTSDSENTLDHLEDDTIYVIGGIVDRNRLKRAAINRAEQDGIATAKLPITDHLQLVTTTVLTCNHVFEILLKYRQNGNDWKKAMLDVLPNRKQAQAKDDESAASGANDSATATKETHKASAD
jgi:tRNA (guanine9-N1)-methyltransferase